METIKNKFLVKIRKIRNTQNMDERISKIFFQGFQAIYYYMPKDYKLIAPIAIKWIVLLNTSKPKFDETVFNETIITLSKYIIKISILKCNTVSFLSNFVYEFFWIMLYLPDICKERIFYEHKKEFFAVIEAIDSCGLYYVQTTFTKMVFKFYSASFVNGGYDLLKEMFEKVQVDESIIKLFTAIDLEVFDLNCRTFLNALNRAKKICNIFSISALQIYIGDVQVKPPRFKNEIIPFWVDFSFSALQFSFYSDPLNENILDRSWPLMTINIDIIDDINFLIIESKLVFVVSLSDSIEISEEKCGIFFNSAREVTLKFPINNDAKLLKQNFMSLFKTVKQKSKYETGTPKQSNKNQATVQINSESKTTQMGMTIIKDVSISDADFAEKDPLKQKLVEDTENIVKLNSMPNYSEISSFNSSTFRKKCYDNIPLTTNIVKQNSVVEYTEQIMDNKEYSTNLVPCRNIIFNSDETHNKEKQPQIQYEKLIDVDLTSEKELEVNQVKFNPTKRKTRTNKNKIVSELAADKIQHTGNKRKVETAITKTQRKTQTDKKRKINKEAVQKSVNQVKPLQRKQNRKLNIDKSPNNSNENITNTLNASSQLFYPTTIVKSYEGSKRDQMGRFRNAKFLKDITNLINNDIYDIRNISNDNIPTKKLKSTKTIIFNNIFPNTLDSESGIIYSPILNEETDNKLVSYSYRRYRFNTETKLDHPTNLKKENVSDDLPKPSAQRKSSRIKKAPTRYLSSSSESIHLNYSSDSYTKVDVKKNNKKEKAILSKKFANNPSKQSAKSINISVVPEIDKDISMSNCSENDDNSIHNQFPVKVDDNNNSSLNQKDENFANIHCVASEQTSHQLQTELVTCSGYNLRNRVNSTANTPYKERCMEMSNSISYIQNTNATNPQSNQNLEVNESISPSNAAVSIVNRNESSNTVNTIQECLVLPLQNFQHGPEKDLEQMNINFKAGLEKFVESYHRSLLDCAKTISKETSSSRSELQSVLHYESQVKKLENEICKINEKLKFYRETHFLGMESMQNILFESIASVKEDMENLRNIETQKLAEAFANITLECGEVKRIIWNNFIQTFIDNYLQNFVC